MKARLPNKIPTIPLNNARPNVYAPMLFVDVFRSKANATFSRCGMEKRARGQETADVQSDKRHQHDEAAAAENLPGRWIGR